jgi:peptide methionine sulfoxide reductase MsrB
MTLQDEAGARALARAIQTRQAEQISAAPDQHGFLFYCSVAATLFDSGSKFNAVCGWRVPRNSVAIVQRPDYSHGMGRVELLCRHWMPGRHRRWIPPPGCDTHQFSFLRFEPATDES